MSLLPPRMLYMLDCRPKFLHGSGVQGMLPTLCTNCAEDLFQATYSCPSASGDVVDLSDGPYAARTQVGS